MTDIVERFYEGEEAKSLLQEQADEIERLRQRVKELEKVADEASDKARLYAVKYSEIVQAITDPENQPSQYGTILISELRKAQGEPVATALMHDGKMVGALPSPPDPDYNREGNWYKPGLIQEPLFTSPSIPEGWQLVPVEPTPEMAEAGAHRRWNKPLRDPDSSREIWRSMLASAPKYNT